MVFKKQLMLDWGLTTEAKNWLSQFRVFQETSTYIFNQLRHLAFQNRAVILVKSPLFLRRHCQLLQGSTTDFTLHYTANVYRQTTDKLMFKNVISAVRWIRKLDIVKCAINKQNTLIFKLKFVLYPKNVLSKVNSHIKVKITGVCL